MSSVKVILVSGLLLYKLYLIEHATSGIGVSLWRQSHNLRRLGFVEILARRMMDMMERDVDQLDSDQMGIANAPDR